jgi:hypothetical protein
MSLLNIASDGLPNLLVLLHAAVIRTTKPMPEADLLEAVAPFAVVDDKGDKARQTLNRWCELGFFVQEQGFVSLPDKPISRRASTLDILPFTRKKACRLVMAEANNPDIWASQGARAADLTRCLAWMLAQDVYRISFGDFESEESNQITDSAKQFMQNSSRRAGLQHYWAPFLGFSRNSFGDIDPTVAVRDALDDILGPGEGLPATAFVERLGTVLPVLDGGRWQQEVLQFVDIVKLPRREPGQLSTALSRAILNLWTAGNLMLKPRSDLGSSVTLTGSAGARSDLTFQWIERPVSGANAA